MTIEVALLISGVSLAFGVYQGVTNLRRNGKIDNKQMPLTRLWLWQSTKLLTGCRV